MGTLFRENRVLFLGKIIITSLLMLFVGGCGGSDGRGTPEDLNATSSFKKLIIEANEPIQGIQLTMHTVDAAPLTQEDLLINKNLIGIGLNSKILFRKNTSGADLVMAEYSLQDNGGVSVNMFILSNAVYSSFRISKIRCATKYGNPILCSYRWIDENV